MGSTLDPSETRLLNDAGEVIAIDRGFEAYSRASECVWGNVVNLGLGLGTLRQILLKRIGLGVDSVRTVEESSDANENYGLAYDDDKNNPEVAGISETVAAADGVWDSAVFDLVKSDIFEDPTFQDNIKSIFPDLSGRVVILSDRGDISLPGFSRSGPEMLGGQFVYLFDRFEPSEGIGELNPHGVRYIPGLGWIGAPGTGRSTGTSTAEGDPNGTTVALAQGGSSISGVSGKDAVATVVSFGSSYALAGSDATMDGAFGSSGASAVEADGEDAQ